ncbi:hypothetical protein GCM10027436_67710 [Actinophytocola sediminis]
MLLAAVLVPIQLADSDDDAGDRAASAEQTTKVTVPTETRTPRPAGRDMEAVTAALRVLDPCQLPGVEFARSQGLPEATAMRTGPHSCRLHADASYSPGVVEKGVKVRVGTHYVHIARYLAAPVTIGDAKAYQEIRGEECRVVVPVSTVRAIEFAHEGDERTDPCVTTRRFAEAAVAKLGDPDSVAMDPASYPYARWDGCTLLARALGAEAKTLTFEPDGVQDPFAGCSGRPAPQSGGHGSRLAITYESAPDPVGPTQQLAGKAVEVLESSESCTASWDNGPSGTAHKWFATTVVELTVGDCEAVPAMVKQVVALASDRPADATPQRPLLYGPDDNDTATKGACVHFSNGNDDDCEPYQEVDLDGTPAEILAVADANRHGQCAVFADAIEAGFGPAYTAVTWAVHCFFVEPKHELVIRVNVSAGGWGTAPSGYGQGDLFRDRRVTEIAGLPAVTFWDSDGSTFDVYVSPHDNLSAPGNLHIGLETQPPRGSDLVTVPLDPARADRAVEVMAEAVLRLTVAPR